jgi:hypothetical protein
LINLHARFLLLDEEDQKITTDIMGHVLDTLEGETGTLITMVDVKGNGLAEMLACGNPLLIQPLLEGAGEVARRIFAQPEGLTQ